MDFIQTKPSHVKMSKKINMNCRLPHNIWSINIIGKDVVVKYNYDEAFCKFIKNSSETIGVTLFWDKYTLGWVANKVHFEKV